MFDMLFPTDIIKGRMMKHTDDFFAKAMNHTEEFINKHNLNDPQKNALLDLFPVMQGTTGFVTTCKFNAVCLTAVALMQKTQQNQ